MIELRNSTSFFVNSCHHETKQPNEPSSLHRTRDYFDDAEGAGRPRGRKLRRRRGEKYKIHHRKEFKNKNNHLKLLSVDRTCQSTSKITCQTVTTETGNGNLRQWDLCKTSETKGQRQVAVKTLLSSPEPNFHMINYLIQKKKIKKIRKARSTLQQSVPHFALSHSRQKKKNLKNLLKK